MIFLRERLRTGAWIISLAMVLGFVTWDGVVRSRHILKVSDGYGVTVDPPAIDGGSPTGYASGRRSLVVPPGASDTLHWVMQTQKMFAVGEWRIRHVDYDNAPPGREVHWAAPFHGWLSLVAFIDHLVSGRPVGIAVERATLESGPVMLALLLVSLIPFLAKRFSPAAAALTALGAVAFYPFYIDFLPGRADHHGLANNCAALTVLFMVMGTTAVRGAARGWLTASGLAGGMGLWISASAQAPVLIGLGLGVLSAGWVGRRGSARISWIDDPGLLRFWGFVGGGMSLAAYAIEYFPSHLGWRLEVNHPLYALAWAGAGETLRVVVLAFRDGPRFLSRRDRVLGSIAVSLVALLPAVIALTGATTFAVADPFIWQLHVLYIAEFLGLARTLATQGLNWSSLGLCLPMGALVLPLWLVARRATAPEVRAQIILTIAPAFLGWIMGWNQIRWLGLAYALSVPVLAVSFRTLRSPDHGTRRAITRWAVAIGLIFLPGAVAAVQRTLAAAEFSAGEIQELAVRDVAQSLRLRGGGERVVVASSPSSTTRMVFSGGLIGLGTLYWENAAGLKNASALFAASSAAQAHEFVQRLGVTHIVVFSWDPFEVVQAQLYRGLADAAPIPADLFIANLLAAPVPPPWLRAIPFPLPDHPVLQGKQVRIWEVTPEQTPAESLAHAANTFLELGQLGFAERLAPGLARFPDDLAATVMLAGIASRQSDARAFAAAADRVLAQLARAPALALDDHIHLVVVLAVGQHVELAREQLRLAVNKANERNLRHLTPGTLSDLLALCDALAVEIPDAALRRLAQSLLPPDKRK